MSLTERRVKADRQTMLVENDYRCHGCGRQFIDRPDMLILDEVQERWDNGAHHAGNQQLLCKDRCNPKKTRVQQQRRKAQGRLYRHRSFPRFALSIVGVALVVYAGARLAGWSLRAHAWPIAGLLLVVVCLFDLHVYRDRRRAMVHRLSAGLAPDVHMPRDKRVVKVHGWTGWWWPRPTAVTVSFAPAFVDTDDTKVRAGIVATTCRIAGNQLADADWSQAHRGRVRLEQGKARREDLTADPLPSPVLEEDTGRDPLERVKQSARKVVGGEVTVSGVVHDAEGLNKFRIGYPAEFDDSDDGNRTELLDRVNAKLDPVRYAAVWDTGRDVLDLTRRPPMPKRVDRPPTADDPWRIDLGVDEHGRVAEWDLRVAPHILVAGPTRSGKTACIRSIITGASLRRFDIYGCDPKRVELAGFATWPGVVDIADTPDTMIAMVERIEALMMDRYDRVKADPAVEAGLRPVLFVIDEFAVFQNLANQAWSKAGMHPVIARVHNIVVLGARCRVHVTIGTQQPSAAALGKSTAIREQMGCRIGCGPLDPQSSGFLFKSQAVGRDLPRKARGRATVDSDDDPPREVQLYWTPDPSLPDAVQTDDNRVLLKELRERTAT